MDQYNLVLDGMGIRPTCITLLQPRHRFIELYNYFLLPRQRDDVLCSVIVIGLYLHAHQIII